MIRILCTALAVLFGGCVASESEDTSPSTEEQDEMIRRFCERARECDPEPDMYPFEECQEIRYANYSVSDFCLEALYDYDSCLIALTCEEWDQHLMNPGGKCSDERSVVSTADEDCTRPGISGAGG